MSKQFKIDYSGNGGTKIINTLTNECVFEFGISDSTDLCNLLNGLSKNED